MAAQIHAVHVPSRLGEPLPSPAVAFHAVQRDKRRIGRLPELVDVEHRPSLPADERFIGLPGRLLVDRRPVGARLALETLPWHDTDTRRGATRAFTSSDATVTY